MKKILLVLLILFLFSCTDRSESADIAINQSEKLVGDFINLIEKDIEADNIKGSVSLVILNEEEILASNAYGLISPEGQAVADTSTIYRIGSITKSFTGFLLLKLQQDGVINLDDPIEIHLPEIKNLADYDKHPPITFRQLASHTSGLDRESRNRDANFGPVKAWQNKVLNAIPETHYRNAPNERFRYSNIGYALLGLAISRVGDQSYIDLVKKEILDPLKMTNTYFEIPENKKIRLAKGMGGGPTATLDYELPLREHEGRGYRIPNGGLYSTPNDMAKFMKACMGYSNILNEESLKALQNTQTPTKRLRANYSFGFNLYEDQGINTVGHGGSTPGYSAHFEFEKSSKFGIIIMRNYNFGNTNLDLRSNALLRNLTLLE